MAYYTLDYIFGYLIKIKPLLYRRAIVIFDRYFTDVIVDAKRSKVNLGVKFLYAYSHLIPKLRYNILLVADVEKIISRKQELDRDGMVEFVRRFVVKLLPVSPAFNARCKAASLILCKTSSTFNLIPVSNKKNAIVFTDVAADIAASFYGLTLAVIFKAMGEQIGIKEIIKGTLPISGGGGYWFLTAYLGMLFCAPSVTYMIDVFNTEQLKTVGTLSIIVNILIPTVCVRINPFSNTVMLFCLYYAVGVLIRRKMIMTDVRKPFLKAMCIIIVVYFIQMVLCIWGRKYPAIYNSRNWLSGNNSLFIMIATVFIFVASMHLDNSHTIEIEAKGLLIRMTDNC